MKITRSRWRKANTLAMHKKGTSEIFESMPCTLWTYFRMFSNMVFSAIEDQELCERVYWFAVSDILGELFTREIQTEANRTIERFLFEFSNNVFRELEKMDKKEGRIES